MRRWLAPLIAAACVAEIAALAATGCGSSAVGVGACKQIEEARCRAAAACPEIPLTPPNYDTGSAVDACIRFYDTACLHGLAVSGYSQAQVSACVAEINASTASAAAIKDAGCNFVLDPWAPPSACSWLVPPDSGTPETSTATTDGGDAGDTGTTSDADADGGD